MPESYQTINCRVFATTACVFLWKSIYPKDLQSFLCLHQNNMHAKSMTVYFKTSHRPIKLMLLKIPSWISQETQKKLQTASLISPVPAVSIQMQNSWGVQWLVEKWVTKVPCNVFLKERQCVIAGVLIKCWWARRGEEIYFNLSFKFPGILAFAIDFPHTKDKWCKTMKHRGLLVKIKLT